MSTTQGIVYDYTFDNSLCINECYKTMHQMFIIGFKIRT